VSLLKNNKYIFSLITLSILALRFIWMGDSSFINDEPLFILKSLKSNAQGEFIEMGLVGKMGIAYGPFFMAYAKSLVLLSKDIFTIYYLNCFFVTALTVTGLVWLIRSIDSLSKWSMLPVIASPFLWFYARSFWDNSFNIPISLLAFAAYMSFLKLQRPWKVYILFSLLAASLQIHLMTLAFVGPMALHFLIFQKNWIRKNTFHFLGAFSLGFLIFYPYLSYLLSVESLNPSQGVGGSRSIFFPFFGAKFFSTFDFSYFLGKGWHKQFDFKLVTYLVSLLMVLTWIAVPIFWIGAFKGISKLKNTSFNKYRPENHAVLISTVIILLHVGMCFLGNLYTHPHYYNGVLVASIFLFMMGFSLMLEKWNKVLLTYTVSLIFALVSIQLWIHSNHGSRKLHYGHTLNDLNKVADLIIKTNDIKQIKFDTFHTKTFPHALKALVDLKKHLTVDTAKTEDKYIVRYKDKAPEAGLIIVPMQKE
jgi:hypothetical protein